MLPSKKWSRQDRSNPPRFHSQWEPTVSSARETWPFLAMTSTHSCSRSQIACSIRKSPFLIILLSLDWLTRILLFKRQKLHVLGEKGKLIWPCRLSLEGLITKTNSGPISPKSKAYVQKTLEWISNQTHLRLRKKKQLSPSKKLSVLLIILVWDSRTHSPKFKKSTNLNQTRCQTSSSMTKSPLHHLILSTDSNPTWVNTSSLFALWKGPIMKIFQTASAKWTRFSVLISPLWWPMSTRGSSEISRPSRHKEAIWN